MICVKTSVGVRLGEKVKYLGALVWDYHLGRDTVLLTVAGSILMTFSSGIQSLFIMGHGLLQRSEVRGRADSNHSMDGISRQS